MWVLMNDLCKPGLEGPIHVTKMLQTKKEQKFDEFEPLYLSNPGMYEKWFVVFEYTINHLSFDYVCLPQLEYYFSCFASFFSLFFCRYLFLNC